MIIDLAETACTDMHAAPVEDPTLSTSASQVERHKERTTHSEQPVAG